MVLTMDKSDSQCSPEETLSLLGFSSVFKSPVSSLGAPSSGGINQQADSKTPALRSVVEEMLGHLYAKPPSAEVYLESRVADVNGPVSDNHSSKTLINTSLPTLEDKSELFKENGDLSNSSTSLSDKTLQEAASPLPEQTLMEKENKTDFRVISKSPIETEDKTPSPAQSLETWRSSSNGIQKLVITKTKGKYRKKQPEGAPPEETSSDNESQSDDSNDSSNDSGNSSSSDSASGSTTSDSGDITTHPPQRNNSSEHQETQLYLGKHMDESPNDEPPSDEDEDLEPLDLKARPDFPSPAHDVSTSLCLTSETCPEQDSDSMPTPLDLCIKKHEDSAMTLQTEEIFCTDNSCIPLSSTAPLLVSSTASSKPSPSGAQKHRRKPKIAEDIERKQKSELKQKRNAQVKHQQRLTQKLQALQQKEFAETKVIPQFPVTSFPSDLIICPVPTKTQVKRGKQAETANNTTFTVVTTNNKASLQSTGKGSQSVTLNVEKLMSYMLPQSSPSRGRGRGRPRGRGRGRGRPSVDSSSQRREKSPRRQTQRNISSENLSVDEPTSDSKSSSECEASDVCDDDDIDDEDEKSATAKIASSGLTSTSGRGTKRHNYGSEGSSPKKKRILPDETEIRIPLEHGWRRQTKIRCFSRSGVRGEVVYFAPCGKKLRNYPEVVRYLQRHGITDITRENFTFSTKINVGEFLERAPEAGRENYIMVSEQEVVARIEEVRSRKGCLGIQVRRTPHQKSKHEEKQQYWEQIQLQHRLEQQEETQQAQELKKLEKKRETKKSKRQKAEELRQKEHEKFVKQQEKFERLEQVRLEKEMKAKQFIEEREMKKQQAAILREQERERRRQHTLLVRALEVRKKHEERERKREELLQEKRMYRERKMEERRIELQLIREMKKPVDDMMLKDSTPLPTLNRIPGVKVAGKAFANILMVFEFLQNFSDALGFDLDKLPTLSMLQLGLLNFDDKTEQELLSVVQHLLVCVIDDPGVPNRPEAVSVLNQNVRDVDVTNSNVSEVLRLFFNALDGTSKMCKWVTEKPFLSLNPTHKSEIIAFLCNELLCSRAVLRQIEYNIETVNNLRRDKWVVEGNLRKLRNLQQTRALKSLVQSHKENSQTVVDGSKMSDVNEKTNKSNTRITMNGDTSVDGKVTENKSAKGNKGRSKYEEEENDDESGNESDATQATSRLSDGEDEELGLSNEELEKKIEKLSKQQAQFHSKLTKAAHTIRGTCFGQDRYCRLYWVTPCAGGIFVEGVESSGVENENIEEQDKTPDTSLEKLENKEKCVDKTRDENVVEEKHVTHTESKLKEVNSNVSEELKAEEENCIKIVPQVIPGNEKQSKSLESKEEISLMNTNENKEKVESTTSKREQTLKTSGTNISSDSPSHYINVKKESPTKLKSSSEVVVLPEIGDKLTNSIKLDIPNTSTSSVPSIEQNWLLHSPFFASVLAGSMLMNGPLLHGRELNGSYFNLPKIEPPVSSSSYGPLLGLNPTFLSAEQMLKTLSEKQSTQKPWFSVLPRMPCDNTSITQGSPCKHTPSKSSEETHRTLSNSSQPPTTSHGQSTPISSMAGHSSPAAALALANLHLGILNGFPPPLIPNPLLNPSVMNSLYTTTEPSRLTSTPNSLGTSVTPSVNPPSFCSTPSTVPSPSSTPGPVPYGSYSNCSIEDSPQVQQRLLTEKLSQYATPRVIPKEYQKGWWRITDVEQLKSLLNSLHPRGMRERHLQKQLQKHFNYACHACTQGQQKAADLEITDTDREISTKPDGAPDSDKEDQWSPEVSLRVDLAILEQIEDMEEKVARASMQMKQGWKVPSRLSSDPTIKFKAACLMPKKEQDCSNFYYQKGIKHRKKEQYVSMEIGENANLKKGSNVEENSSQEEKMESETTKSITEDKEESCELSENIEKVASSPSINFGDVNPIDIAKERLLLLESAIERRYIKPPLGIVTELNLSSRNSCSSCLPPPTTAEEREEELPRGLLRWRASVQKCQTADQLAMCLNMLEACIAWDKSIMRASCQFCHSGANEEMLLLCDGCDKGYHTYCFKPKMETIPDGDWYCYECLNKATGDKVCVLCGKKGKLIRCDLCPKTYHIDCLDPPLLRPPKGKWTCVSCKVQLKKSNKPKPVSKEKDREKEKETSKEKDREVPPSKKSDSNSSNKSKINEKKEKSKPLINKEFAAARTILDEMELHEDSWPFLLPVDTKQFPTYKKVIKKPMDLSTIRSKLEGGSYKTKDDFSVDVRLIFDNCETFNEDESPVGRAGHNMRAYFDSQWADLNSS